MNLAAAISQPLRSAAQRQIPIAPHLQFFVTGFQAAVIERVRLLVLSSFGPDQRLVRVTEARAAEVWHRVRLNPHHVIQYPVAQVLQDRSNAENVVVGADNPECTVWFEKPATLG